MTEGPTAKRPLDDPPETVVDELEIDDWRRVEEIFHRVSALPEEQWPAEVRTQASGDSRIEREVLALLESTGEAADQLDRSIRGAVDQWLDGSEPEAEREPRQIGPFRVVERIGQGGLAIVYLAEREKPYRQQVAIKLLKRGMDTDEILGRLKLEGQILAQLEHPNIARLLDGGWTEDGRPYFVLEYVEGEPIDQYCDSRALDVRARLALFYRSCLAVQQAHNRLIIHRDLKPSNLLVTEEGEPKLLDFGIAKLLDASGLGITAAHTQPGVQWMTPDYAAPEQVAGETLTTAVDIYALGILLYQLLCGSLPRHLAGQRPSEIERQLAKPADPPSSRVDAEVAARRATSPDRLVQQLRGDLDTIVAKALQVEPERRYASVQQLAEDVDRYLRFEPVLARPDTWSYRGAKFVRRNRAGVAAVAAIFLSLVIGVVGTTQSLRIADHQRRLAEQRLGEVEAVMEFTTDLFEIADPGEARGSSVTVREVLDQGAGSVLAGLEEQPAISARLMDTMGQVYQNLGLYESAAGLLEAAVDRWQDAREDLESAGSRRLLAAVLVDEGRFAEAAEQLERVRRAERHLLSAPHPEIARSLHLEGLVRHQLEGRGAGADLLRQALAMRLELFGDGHPAVAESRNDLGELLTDMGEHEAAEEQYRRALAARRNLYGQNHPRVAETLHNLATNLRHRGQLEEARIDFEQVIEVRRALLGEVHRDVAVSLNNLADVQHELGHHEEALATLERAYEIARQAVPQHPLPARVLANVALELRDVGRIDEAVEVMTRSLDERKALYGEPSEHLVQPKFNFSLLLSQMERRPEAIALLEETLSDMESLGIDDGRSAYPLTLLADLLAREGRCARSSTLAERALALRAHLEADHPLRRRTEEVAALCATTSSGPVEESRRSGRISPTLDHRAAARAAASDRNLAPGSVGAGGLADDR